MASAAATRSNRGPNHEQPQRRNRQRTRPLARVPRPDPCHPLPQHHPRTRALKARAAFVTSVPPPLFPPTSNVAGKSFSCYPFARQSQHDLGKNHSSTKSRDHEMKLKLALVLSATAFLFSIAGTEAVTPSGSKMPAVQSEAINIGCVGGKRCTGYYYKNGVRVCRAYVACR